MMVVSQFEFCPGCPLPGPVLGSACMPESGRVQVPFGARDDLCRNGLGRCGRILCHLRRAFALESSRNLPDIYWPMASHIAHTETPQCLKAPKVRSDPQT